MIDRPSSKGGGDYQGALLRWAGGLDNGISLTHFTHSQCRFVRLANRPLGMKPIEFADRLLRKKVAQ